MISVQEWFVINSGLLIMERVRKTNSWVRGGSEAGLATLISLIAKEVGINMEGVQKLQNQ